MTITTTGYVTKRYPEIIAELRQGLIDVSGNPNLDLSDDSLLGVLNNVYGLAYADLHSLGATLWSSMDVDTAEGLALNALVRRIGLERLDAKNSVGYLQFTSTLGTVIAAGTQVRDLAGVIVETDSTITLDTSAVNCAIVVPTGVNNFTYNIGINGTTYSYLSDGTATVAEIVDGLVLSISANPDITVSNEANKLKIQCDLVNPYNLVIGANLTIQSITKNVAATSVDAGEYELEAGTLNRLVFPNPAVTVTNQDKFLTGRFTETDAELRARFKASVGGQGKATVTAIKAKLGQVEGVTKAFVDENTTLITSPTGIPAKAIECTVKGGTNLDVATALFDVKPAGIETYGNTTQVVVDDEGTNQTVKFSRPIDVYIHLQITYQLYNEQVFPVNGEDQIAQAVVDSGNSLEIGEDVLIQRLIGAIYTNLQGIGNITMLIGRTASPLDTPTYTSGNIAIGLKEESLFDLSRVSVALA